MRISRVKPSRKFPLQLMSIYGNDNISKIAKLTSRELPHLVQNGENHYTKIMAYTVYEAAEFKTLQKKITSLKCKHVIQHKTLKKMAKMQK